MIQTDLIDELIGRGALFVVNHSGGKDSQAMHAYIVERVPANQILVLHADLPGADWAGTWDHIIETVAPHTPIKTMTGKTFMEMVERSHQRLLDQVADPAHERTKMASAWPSPKYRQCTSDLKRTPIEKAIRNHLKANPQFGGLVVSCMGIRAEESTGRSKLVTFKLNTKNSVAGREWYDWLPIHGWLVGEVFAQIAAVGQTPHWAYHAGMERLSCMFCIMASPSDLTTAAELNPDTYAQYVAMEKRLGFTFTMPTKGKRCTLEDVTGITAKTT